MSLLKVSIQDATSGDNLLCEFDVSKSLEENISDICLAFNKPPSTAYGLKLIATNNGQSIQNYLTTDNIHELNNGYFLQLVFSLSYYANRIFEHISDEYKERSFQDLYDLSIDPGFIKEIVKTEKHVILMDIFTNSELSNIEQTACLIAIVHLFQKQYIINITEAFLSKIVTICKNLNNNNELTKYALSVVHKILCHRNPNFLKWKEETIKQISISDLMHYIEKRNAPDLQYGALLVINALIRCCKGDKRIQLIKEINQKKFRELIHKCVIEGDKVDKNMAHELYLYQHHVLSLHAETLSSTIPESDIVRCIQLETVDNEIKKMTMLMDFDENVPKHKTVSVENLIDSDGIRISLASLSSKYSEDSRFSNRVQSGLTNVNVESLKISLLTSEALNHYKQHHPKNFQQSQVEEQIYEPGIVASSEIVVRMLAKILHIGMEPDRTSGCYQPTVFTSSSRTPFFFQLFSRTMWLLSKTRREMKATTMLDYQKVLNVLEKQVVLVLDSKPKDFKQLTAEMLETGYEVVLKIWKDEKKEELKQMLADNPSIKVLKQRFAKVNEELIFQQRMNFVRSGTVFPKFNEKKINGNFIAKLSNNRRDLLINDYNHVTKFEGETVAYSIADVKYVVEGKACPHVKNNSVKDPKLAFSIIDNANEFINFKAADRKTASYWLDALNLLLGKENRSDYYKNELAELVEMDVVLHLMEIQNVTIPKKPPKMPRLPFEIKPPIPRKPPGHTYKK